MAKTIPFFLLLSLFFPVLLFSGILQAQTDPDGVYWSEDKSIKIQVIKTGNKLRGKILETSAEIPASDTKNPDKALRGRKVVGTDLFWDMTWNGSTKRFEKGRLYSPQRCREIEGEAWAENASTLYVKGYIGFFSKTITFHRVRQ